MGLWKGLGCHHSITSKLFPDLNKALCTRDMLHSKLDEWCPLLGLALELGLLVLFVPVRNITHVIIDQFAGNLPNSLN